MSWRLARCLDVLRDQVNASAPGRSKDNDGTIGDTAHASRTSDHNPNDDGLVLAIDFTHDPAGGFDAHRFAEILRQNKDPRIKYVISNRRIMGDPGYGARNNKTPWMWSEYTGENPHTAHTHVSVYASSEGVTSPWKLDSLPAAPQIDPRVGRGSWYSQYEGKYSWVDKEDEPNSNALRVPDSKQGIALYNKDTLGKWFNVTAPNGVTLRLQQTDIGPNPKTGRLIDIAAVAAEKFGYSPRNFPTDQIFTWAPASAPAPEPPMPTPTPTPQPQPLPSIDPQVAAQIAEMLAPIVKELVGKNPGLLSGLFSAVVSFLPQLGVWGLVASVILNAFGGLGSSPMAGAENAVATTSFATFGGALLSGLLNMFKGPAK